MRSAAMCAGDANWWTAHQRSRVSVALSWLRSSAFKVWRRASASRRAVKLSGQSGPPLPSAPATRARSMSADNASVLRVPTFIFCACLDGSRAVLLLRYGFSAEIRAARRKGKHIANVALGSNDAWCPWIGFQGGPQSQDLHVSGCGQRDPRRATADAFARSGLADVDSDERHDVALLGSDDSNLGSTERCLSRIILVVSMINW